MNELLQNQLVLVGLGAVMSFLTQLAKKFKWDYNLFLVVISLLLGGAYVWFKTGVAKEIQTQIVSTFGAIVGYATIIYNYLLKK